MRRCLPYTEIDTSIQCLGLDADFLTYRDFYFRESFESHQFNRFKKVVRALYRLANRSDFDYDGLKFLTSRGVMNITMVAIVCYYFRDFNHDHLRKSVMKWLECVR